MAFQGRQRRLLPYLFVAPNFAAGCSQALPLHSVQALQFRLLSPTDFLLRLWDNSPLSGTAEFPVMAQASSSCWGRLRLWPAPFLLEHYHRFGVLELAGLTDTGKHGGLHPIQKLYIVSPETASSSLQLFFAHYQNTLELQHSRSPIGFHKVALVSEIN